MFTSRGCSLRLLSLALVLLPAAGLNAADETAATARGRIFGKVWHTGLRPEDSFKYLN